MAFKKMSLISIAAAAICCSGAAHAAIVPATWATIEQGEVNGVAFSVSGVIGPVVEISNALDFIEPGHGVAPLFGVDALIYGAGNKVVIKFETPAQDLLLYAGSWRGAVTTGNDPAITYTLSEDFDVLSGFVTAVIAGSSIAIDDDNVPFENGILRFLNPVSTLIIDSDAGSVGAQALTFALDANGVSEVPIPGALGLFLLGGAGMGVVFRKK